MTPTSKTKSDISKLTNYYSNNIEIIYECRCMHDNKYLHHFDYAFPFKVLKLCPSCHAQEHARLNKEAREGERKLSNLKITPIPIEVKNFKQLIKSEQKKFMDRVTPIAGQKLTEFIEKNQFTSHEIAEEIGTVQTRISEIRNYDKYGLAISKPNLRKMLKRGLLTIHDIEAEIQLSDAEKSFLSKLVK